MAVSERMNEKIEGNPGRVPSRIPSSLYTYRGINYEFYNVTPDNMTGLRIRALPLEEVLTYDPIRTPREIVANIQPGSKVIFATHLSFFRRLLQLPPKDVGVVTYDIEKVFVGGKEEKALVTGVRAILPEYQGKGMGTQFAVDAILRHRPRFLIAKTRNWVIFYMNEKTRLTRVGGMFPIDGPLSPEAQEAQEKALPRSKYNLIKDKTTGLCENVYPPGDPDQFTPPKTHIPGMRIHERMKELGVFPGGRNGLMYCIEVDGEAVEARIAERNRTQKPLPAESRPFLRALRERIADILRI